MKHIYIFGIFISMLMLYSCHQREVQSDSETTTTERPAPPAPQAVGKENDTVGSTASTAAPSITTSVFYNAGPDAPRGYGYDILMDGKVYVHQAQIPAIQGNRAFVSAAEAQKAADLVAMKIKNNIMPPSVTPEELKSLGITVK